MRKLFILNGQDAYDQELTNAFEKAEGVKFFQKNKDFSFEYLNEKEIDVVVSNGLAEETYYLLRGLNIPAITIGSWREYSKFSDIVIDYLGNDDKRYFAGPTSQICGNDDFPAARIVDLITKLEWDSNFFGFNIAFLSCMHLTENIMHRIARFMEREEVRLVEYLCNCHNAESVRLAEKYGFHFVDVRLTYRFDLKKNKEVSGFNKDENLKIRESCPDDALELVKIARNSYVDSRYYFDRNFTLEQCQRFYEDWILKSMKGEFDDIVFVALVNDKLAGLISCKKMSSDIGKIGIVGVAADFQGKGIGKYLVFKSLNWFKNEGCSQVDVITQGRNYAAQRLYQSIGFGTKTVQLWYHKWLKG